MGLSEGTQRAYAADWNRFETWCRGRSQGPLPADPAAVAAHLLDLAKTHSTSSVNRAQSAISRRHKDAGYPAVMVSREVEAAMAKVRRKRGRSHAKLTVNDIRAFDRMVDGVTANIDAVTPGLTPQAVRDRALILVGWHSGLRRSALVGLDVEDVPTLRRHLPVRLEQGRCPQVALTVWLGILPEGDPLFRPIDRHDNIGDGRLSGKAVALVVKRAAEAAGLDPAKYAADSLRLGKKRVDQRQIDAAFRKIAAAEIEGSNRASVSKSTTAEVERLYADARRVAQTLNHGRLWNIVHDFEQALLAYARREL